MLKVGITGTQDGLNHVQLKLVNYFLCGLYYHHDIEVEIHEGQCIGADEQISQLARNLGFKVIGHPPLNQSKVSTFVPDVMLPPLDYLDRNHAIVDDGWNLLIAAPKTNKEVLRSGTWATIRYARRQHRPIQYIMPGVGW